MIFHLYRTKRVSKGVIAKLKQKNLISDDTVIVCEMCYNVETHAELEKEELIRLTWLLMHDDGAGKIYSEFIYSRDSFDLTVEVGPRLNFCTPHSTNVVCILRNIGISKISRIEISHIFHFKFQSFFNLMLHKNVLTDVLHDKMTETLYSEPILSFNVIPKPSPIFFVDIYGKGRKALDDINKTMGLAMDEWDLSYYYDVFVNKFGRNPTNVECFDLAQSNSEHCRHWFFKGRMIIDSLEMERSLLEMVMDTQKYSNQNNVVAFSDNSSAIRGFNVHVLALSDPRTSSVYKTVKNVQDICFTAETHNFPTGVAPFPGAATGSGGRIRDVQAIGVGGIVVAGTAGYCVGNLRMSGYDLPWEFDPGFNYPNKFASASEIIIEASNGASDYGNKFGEPLIGGFCRSFGMIVPSGEWREWIKPIMFSGGIGQISHDHVAKSPTSEGQLVVKIGGPIYRIGVGGGAASSVQVQGEGDRDCHLDFGAVQRGDPQMENKLNRVIRGCIDLGQQNPIKSIHDQGAGGNGNVLKELVSPLGAEIHADAFTLGDKTISILELWGAEYQESNGVLLNECDLDLFINICRRERCPVDIVGRVTDDGRIRLKNRCNDLQHENFIEYPVDLDLNVVLGKIPKKTFNLDRQTVVLTPLDLPLNLKVHEILSRVLRLPSVGSKRFLTNKVDRSVGGLVVQQQCVGPLHTPLADVSVVALSYWDSFGSATSIGEQPIKLLLSPKSGARLCVMEALTNLVASPVTCLEDIKISGNWMWPAKLCGEGSALYDACVAFCDLLKDLSIAVDGGKDSLSMAANIENNVVVKSPGSLVVSTYVGCPDINLVVTPDLKGNGSLLWIKLSTKLSLGGSALAQSFCQLGDICPDVEDVDLFKRSWICIQNLIKKKMINSIHDISDGGLITCVLEMAFAGNVGCILNMTVPAAVELAENVPFEVQLLFSEELGWIMEISDEHLDDVLFQLSTHSMTSSVIGRSCAPFLRNPVFTMYVNEKCIFDRQKLGELRAMWEDTSYHLEKLQCDPDEVDLEYEYYKNPCITKCPYFVNYSCLSSSEVTTNSISVAILREEGSNGDREMAAAFIRAGFEAWDVTMQDLLTGSITLDRFRGIAFVGGFSYGDVLGSSKGWAAAIRFNDSIRKQFMHFRHRSDTFSLGVCNGCQLMAWLGWLTNDLVDNHDNIPSVLLTENKSQRFESRFGYVEIPENTNSIMLSKLKGSRLGVWISHGEGRFCINDEDIFKNGQIALHYVMPDRDYSDIVNYPFNPNGSPRDIAGICSKDGRHLALMPHPERSIMWWQWAYCGQLDRSTAVSPWLSMFTSCLEWAEKC